MFDRLKEKRENFLKTNLGFDDIGLGRDKTIVRFACFTISGILRFLMQAKISCHARQMANIISMRIILLPLLEPS